MVKGTGPRYFCFKCGRSVRGGETLFMGCNEPDCPIKKNYYEDIGWKWRLLFWIIALVIIFYWIPDSWLG